MNNENASMRWREGTSANWSGNTSCPGILRAGIDKNNFIDMMHDNFIKVITK